MKWRQTVSSFHMMACGMCPLFSSSNQDQSFTTLISLSTTIFSTHLKCLTLEIGKVSLAALGLTSREETRCDLLQRVPMVKWPNGPTHLGHTIPYIFLWLFNQQQQYIDLTME